MDNKKTLNRILVHAESISKYFDKNVDFDSFQINLEKIEAILFNFIQIGEQAKKLPKVFVDNYTDLKLIKSIGLRNLISHNYEGVSIRIIYDICKKEIPIFIIQLKKLLK